MKAKICYFLFLLLFLSTCSKETIVDPTAADTPDYANIQGLPQVDLQAIEAELEAADAGIDFRNTVELPAGSVDALAAAVAETTEGGVILVKAGQHTESAPVLINKTLHLIGEDGAVMTFATQPLPLAVPIQAGLNFKNAPRSSVRNLEIRSASNPGGTAILTENSPWMTIRDNDILDFQFAILIQQGDYSRIAYNHVVTTGAWQTGQLANTYGITVVNGDQVLIYKNDVSNAIFGIWACDKNGLLLSNYTHGNLIGINLCKVPDKALPLPNGELVGAELPATGWLTQANNSSGNFSHGILVIDGANRNFVMHNTLGNNGAYDIELTTDTNRFGFLTPKAYRNFVIAGKNQKVKDCGEENTVYGGLKVDTSTDMCN